VLCVYLLGDLRLYWNEEPLPLIQTTKARSLFAYLVLNRRTTHSRAVLAGIFWPDMPEEHARRRLRQALWHIARVVDRLPLGPYLLREGDAVGFNTALPHWVDVDEFEALSQGGIEEMAQAAALYRGQLLPEVFDDWVLVDRERLRERWLGLLERLALAYWDRGKIQAAAEVCRRLLRADPWHEPAARMLMRILADLGRVGEALQVYFELYDHLKADLGIAPSAETTALYSELRTAHPRAPAIPPLRLSAQPQLADRKVESATLEAAIQSAHRGQGRVVLLTGPPGIGKTRLALAAAEKAHRLGFWAIYARAAEPLGPPAPYSPLDQALRIALEALGGPPPGLSLLALAALSNLLPDLVRPPAGLDPTNLEPRHFHAAFAGVLATLADPGPLLLVLDNFHWADPAILQVLEALIPRLAELRLLLLVAFRPYELPPEIQGINRLVVTPSLHRLDLQPLSPEEVSTLAAGLLGGPLPATFTARLHRETGGNPLFVIEVVHSLAEGGLLYQKPDGGWALPEEEALPLPATLQQAIAARLDRLTTPTRRILQQAAVMGGDFDFDILLALSGEDEERLLERLDELLARGLLVEENGQYRFAHELIRRVLYDETRPRLRRLWHRRAAKVLAHLAPHWVAARTRHSRAAEEWPETLELALSAAEHALALFSLDEALTFYRMAQEAEEHLGDEPSPARLRRLRGEARVHRLYGNPLAEAEALEGWRATAQALGDPSAEALALTALADNLCRRGRSAEALSLAQSAVHLAQERVPDALAPALHALGSCHEAQGELNTALELYRQSVTVAHQADDPRREAESLNSLAIALESSGEVEEAAEMYRRAATLAAACGDRLTESRALNNMATIHTLRGDLGPARRAYEGVLAAVEAMDIREGIALIRRNLAEVWLLMGHLEKARTYLEAALELVVKLDRPADHAKVLIDLAGWAVAAGNPKEALGFLRKAYQTLPGGELREEHLYYHYQSVGAHLALGDTTTAADRAAQLAQLARETGMAWLEGEVAFQEGRVAAAWGDLEAAERLLRRAVQVWEAQGFRENLAKARAKLGLVLRQAGKEDEATGILASAWEELARRMLRLDLARLLEGLGHPPPLPGQKVVELPRLGAPLRRHLTPQERIGILWTPDAGPLEPPLRRIPLRRARIRRLLTEAAVQGAAPTIQDLTEALGVSSATMNSDLAALRREGWPTFTRGCFTRFGS
jgi:predicted ATPase